MSITRRSVLLTAASAWAAGQAGPSAAHTRKFIVQAGSPSPNSGFIPMYVSQKLGFFAEEGLEVEVRYTRGSTIAMQLVSTGQADSGFFVYDALIAGYGEGLRGTYFYQYYTKPIFQIGYPADGGIRSAADFPGKRIGVANLGSAGVPVAKSILRALDVDPASVTFVPVGVGNQALVALKQNQVDAFCYWDAPFGSLELLGTDLKYIQHPKLKDVGSGGYVASPKAFQERRDDLVRFGRAAAKGTAYVLRNPEAAIKIYWEVNPAGRPSGDAQSAMKKMLVETKHIFDNIRVPTSGTGRPIFGAINLEALQTYIDVNALELGLQKPPKAGEIATPDLIDEINKFDLAQIERMADSAGK